MTENQQPVAWLYEDTLPEEYPYDAMWPHSAVRDGVRMFPVFAPPQRKPLEFMNHYLIGKNNLETEQEAIETFAKGFANLAKEAEGNFIFVRRAPELRKEETFDSGTRWGMVGRFSIAKLKERSDV